MGRGPVITNYERVIAHDRWTVYQAVLTRPCLLIRAFPLEVLCTNEPDYHAGYFIIKIAFPSGENYILADLPAKRVDFPGLLR